MWALGRHYLRRRLITGKCSSHEQQHEWIGQRSCCLSQHMPLLEPSLVRTDQSDPLLRRLQLEAPDDREAFSPPPGPICRD